MSIARMLANSVRLALPRMTAPAARSRATSVASRTARASASASEPAVVCCLSPVAMLSLTRIGMPASGRSGLGLHAVERRRDRERVRVDLAHRIEPRPGPVDRLDTLEIGPRQRARRDLPSASACCNSAIVAFSIAFPFRPAVIASQRDPAIVAATRAIRPTAARLLRRCAPRNDSLMDAYCVLRQIPVEDLLAGPEHDAACSRMCSSASRKYLSRCGAPMM